MATNANREQAELLARIIVLEKQLLETDRQKDTFNSEINEIYTKLEKLKDDLRLIKDASQIEPRLQILEKAVGEIKAELPELIIIKKLFMGLIAFILTAFLALIWNSLVLQHGNSNKDNISEVAKKVIDEYNKGNNSDGKSSK